MNKLDIIYEGIRLKLERGENLESILLSYVKLTEAEKQELRVRITEENT